MSRAKPEDLDGQLRQIAAELAPRDPLWRRVHNAYQARYKARARAAAAEKRIMAGLSAIATRYVDLKLSAEKRVNDVLGYHAAPQGTTARINDPPAGHGRPDDGPYLGNGGDQAATPEEGVDRG